MGNDEIFKMEWRFMTKEYKSGIRTAESGNMLFINTLQDENFFERVNFSIVIEKCSKKGKFAPERMKLKLGQK